MSDAGREEMMGFNSPDRADYANVVRLNHAWLTLLQHDLSLARALDCLPVDLRERMTNLSGSEITRLANTPFLLLSYRENEDSYWTRTLNPRHERDLFSASAAGAATDADTLISAGLGFAWQLARRNPYVLRLFCGATLYWSERIAELTFFELLDAFRATGDPPILRFGHQRDLWRKLLDTGVSRQPHAAEATQITALQSVLTHTATGKQETWSLAARSVGAPARRVADSDDSTQN